MNTHTVLCDRCRQPIRSWRELVVWCDSTQALQAKRAYEAQVRQQERRETEALASGGVEAWLQAAVLRPLATVPRVEDVPWQVVHLDCITDAEWQRGYPIEGTRINTVRKALAWTLHLMEKTWFEFTDWRRVMQKLFGIPEV